MKRTQRPLWRCPKCQKYYVTRNVWHACARHTVEEHFAGKEPKLKALFQGLVGLARRNGPLRVVPGKTGIAFRVRMRFAGAIVRRDTIEAGFILPQRVEHPRLRKVIAYSPRAYGHHVEIRSPADLDDELAGWLREAYHVGAQTDLLAGRKGARPEPGDFAWSEPFVSKPAGATTGAAGSAKSGRTLRTAPLWKCPKCGRTFPTQNQMHICSRLTLKDMLEGKSPHAVGLFRKIVALARRCGSVQIVPQKTRIALQARKTFLGVKFLRDAIECELSLARRIEHPRFRQILSVGPRSHYHYLRVFSAKELSRDVREWLGEDYRVAAG